MTFYISQDSEGLTIQHHGSSATLHRFPGVQIVRSDTTWFIGSKDSGVEGFVYEVWWYDEAVSDLYENKAAVLDMNLEKDPYKSHGSKSCHKDCRDRRQSCTDSGEGKCMDRCSMKCYGGCYNLEYPRCILTCPQYCKSCETDSDKCLECLACFEMDDNKCQCARGLKVVEDKETPMCVSVEDRDRIDGGLILLSSEAEGKVIDLPYVEHIRKLENIVESSVSYFDYNSLSDSDDSFFSDYYETLTYLEDTSLSNLYKNRIRQLFNDRDNDFNEGNEYSYNVIDRYLESDIDDLSSDPADPQETQDSSDTSDSQETQDSSETSEDSLSVHMSVTKDGKVKITFDKQLANMLDAEDVVILVDGASYSLDQIKLVQTEDGLEYEIEIKGLDISSDNQLSIRFLKVVEATDGSVLAQEIISSSDDESMSPDSDLDTKDSKYSSQKDYLAQDPDAEEVASKCAIAAKAVTSIALMMSYTSTSGLWAFINTIQLLSVTPLLNVDLPVMLFSTLIGLGAYNPIPNFMTSIVPKLGPEPFKRPLLLNYETRQFYINAGNMLITLAIMIAIFPLLVLLQACLSENTKLNTKITEFLKGYRWNVFIRFFIEGYLDIGIAAAVQIYKIDEINDYDDSNTMVNIVSGFIALVIATQVLVILFPFALGLFIYRNHTKVRDSEFMKRWGSIFEEFYDSEGMLSSRYYYIHFLIRRLLIIASFFCLKNWPMAQVIVASGLCWIVRYN